MAAVNEDVVTAVPLTDDYVGLEMAVAAELARLKSVSRNP
ncbi:MAG: hypothetical protein BroJett015_22010 [Chloroflexota bacterium]|nr:MAG: hypothetical protein BroJett015_22010 [Chloroflexota bacterium]